MIFAGSFVFIDLGFDDSISNFHISYRLLSSHDITNLPFGEHFICNIFWSEVSDLRWLETFFWMDQIDFISSGKRTIYDFYIGENSLIWIKNWIKNQCSRNFRHLPQKKAKKADLKLVNSSGFSSKIFYFTGKAWLYQVYTYIIHNNKTLKI